jgi:hypothetical protein
MPGHLRAFAAASGDGLWTGVLDHTYGVFDAFQTVHSPVTGLLADFIADPLGTPDPVPPGFLEGPNDGAYDYNACRDPWRLGTDYVGSGDARAKSITERITTWFRAGTGDDPSQIKAGYQLNGSLSPGADYRSMAFVAPLGVGAMVDAANQAWLDAIWGLVVATPIEAEAYYENTLKLLGMVVMSGNWWTPQAVSGGCAPPSTPLCTSGGYASKLRIKIGGLSAGPNRQTLQLKGALFFPQGTPAAAPYTDGAQILIEDVGNGGAALYELSRFTTAVPSQAAGVCDPSEGWSASGSRTLYRNRSGALDPPACTAGSAAGLSQIKYKPRSAHDLDLQLKARNASLPAPLGPLRVTYVLGSSQAASDGGLCAISAEIPCTVNASGRTVKCQ